MRKQKSLFIKINITSLKKTKTTTKSQKKCKFTKCLFDVVVILKKNKEVQNQMIIMNNEIELICRNNNKKSNRGLITQIKHKMFCVFCFILLIIFFEIYNNYLKKIKNLITTNKKKSNNIITYETNNKYK